jgi:hypothetical protein
MHGADYDMTMFKREFGKLPAVVYDTQIGARLLGARRFGLGDLVKEYFGVELSKSSQKADWGKRPLSPKMIEYALNDVHYLLDMGDMIVSRLRNLGRYDGLRKAAMPPARRCSTAMTRRRKCGASRAPASWSAAASPACAHFGTGAMPRPRHGTARPSWSFPIASFSNGATTSPPAKASPCPATSARTA